MKTTLFALVALFGSFALNAQAQHFSLYVTHADQVSPQQVQLGSLVQKNILIDTQAKRLSLFLSPVCQTGLPCPEKLNIVQFELTQLKTKGSNLIQVKAKGQMKINGENAMTTVEIAQNQNNATTIQITTTLSQESPRAVSTFVGSPAEKSNGFLFF